MISDQLFEYAFAYKKTKLWKVLFDMDLFAVRLSDGNIGYISIMGAMGEYCALGLYVGEEGVQSFFTAAEADQFQMMPQEYQEHLMCQNCLQCSFEKKDDLALEEREEVKQYARAHGIRLSGRNAYPAFSKYLPNHIPWQLQTGQEQQMLCEALEAAIEMARLLETRTPDELGFEETNCPKEIPMLEKEGNTYVLKKTSLPEKRSRQWPVPRVTNDIMAANLKKAERKGVWECKIVRFLEAVKDPEEEIPVFPVILLAVDSQSEFLLPVSPVCNYEDHPEELLNLFMDVLLQQHICPKELKVEDERTYAFAESFCKKMGIPITMEEELPVLEEAEYDFFNHFGGNKEEEIETIMEFFHELQNMREDQIRQLPPEILTQIKSLIGQEVLPLELEKKLKNLLSCEEPWEHGERIVSFSKNSGKIKGASPVSYLISVSLCTGCYRHIRISGESALWELHSSIIDAFEFFDDHAHAFFMDNRSWSDYDCYYAEGVDDDCRNTQDYTLKELDLYKGKQFKYVFDFGDEWTFQCKVLRVLEEDTEHPVIVKSVGEAPKQYGSWEDE